jgi:hypothetical protein
MNRPPSPFTMLLSRHTRRRDQLEGKIQERYGIAKDQARKDVDTWFQTLP